MGVEVYPFSVLTLALGSVSGQGHGPAALPPRRASETIWGGDETGYFCLVSNLHTENRRRSLYCKIKF